MNPLISINLCCYNSEKYLRETLQSIAEQTYQHWELVVINDGSSDATEAIVQEFQRQGHPVLYQYQANHGLSYSRNRALALSRGEYVAFIDHDDLWLPDKLERQVDIIREGAEDVELIYTRASYFRENGEEQEAVARYAGRDMPEGRILEDLLLGDDFIVLSSAVARKDACLSLGGFPADFRYAEDYYLFAGIAANYRVRCVQSVCCRYRLHGDNSTLQLKTRGCREKLEIFRKWSPFLGPVVSEERKDAKRKELETLIGAMMMKYDRRYVAGFLQIAAKGSFVTLLREGLRSRRA